MGKPNEKALRDVFTTVNPIAVDEFKAANQWLPHAVSIAKTVAEKNAAYGSSFDASGDFLRLLYPDGMAPEQYGDALTLARMFDKMMRVAHDPGAFGESPYRDLCGYALLAVERAERKK